MDKEPITVKGLENLKSELKDLKNRSKRKLNNLIKNKIMDVTLIENFRKLVNGSIDEIITSVIEQYDTEMKRLEEVIMTSTEMLREKESLVSELKKQLEDNEFNEQNFNKVSLLKTLSRQVDDLTKENKTLNLIIAINYGSRQEITSSVKKIAHDIVCKKITVNDINEKIISDNLYTKGVPDPDLIIRTGGDSRLSNFLLWQSAYSELIFIKKYWPEFNQNDFLSAINEFNQRDYLSKIRFRISFDPKTLSSLISRRWF